MIHPQRKIRPWEVTTRHDGDLWELSGMMLDEPVVDVYFEGQLEAEYVIHSNAIFPRSPRPMALPLPVLQAAVALIAAIVDAELSAGVA